MWPPSRGLCKKRCFMCVQLYNYFAMLVKVFNWKNFLSKGRKRFKLLATRKYAEEIRLSMLLRFPNLLQSVLSCIKLCHSLSLYFNVHYKNYIGYTYVMSMSCRVKPVYPLLLFTLYPFGYVMYYYFSTFNLAYKVLLIFRLHFYLKYKL